MNSAQQRAERAADWLAGLPTPQDWLREDQAGALDRFFAELRGLLGADWQGYRNHCQRVLINAKALRPDMDLELFVPALVFHDIALWTHATVDYLEPSAQVARAYLEQVGLADWVAPVEAMILWHHKQTRYQGPHQDYVETLRRADMGDASFGLQGAVPREALREGRARFPNAGFHAMLLRRTLGRLCSKPWSPLPMLRW